MNLQGTSLFRQRNLVAGEWIGADDGVTIDVNKPSKLSVVGAVPNCGEAETLRAIASAEACFASFKKTTAAHRGALLEKWFDLIMAAQEDLATIMTLEQGKPLAEAKVRFLMPPHS